MGVGSWVHLEQILTVTVTFVQAIFVLVTFVHIRNISAVTDTVKGKVNARSRQCQGKVKARSRQGQGKFMARSRKGLGKVTARSKARSRGKFNNSNSFNEYQINVYRPQLTPYE